MMTRPKRATALMNSSMLDEREWRDGVPAGRCSGGLGAVCARSEPRRSRGRLPLTVTRRVAIFGRPGARGVPARHAAAPRSGVGGEEHG